MENVAGCRHWIGTAGRGVEILPWFRGLPRSCHGCLSSRILYKSCEPIAIKWTYTPRIALCGIYWFFQIRCLFRAPTFW